MPTTAPQAAATPTRTRTDLVLRVFADLLTERYLHAGEAQADASEWLEEYLRTHDLEADLRTAETTAPDHLRDETMDAIAVIRAHIIMHPPKPAGEDTEVGPASVSKWRNRRSFPKPDKWPAVAAYLDLQLGEFYRCLLYSEMPRSVVELQRRLASERKENRDLANENRALREELARAERAVRALEDDVAQIRSRQDRHEAERPALVR